MPQSDLLTALATAGDLSRLEDEWIAAAAEDPTDLEVFLPAVRELVAREAEEVASSLLEVLDGQLVERALWPTRQALLRAVGSLFLAPAPLHDAIVATLRAIRSDRPSFQALAEHVGLFRAIEDIPKTWDKVKRLEGLLQYDVGAVVEMEGRGVGRVSEVNLTLETLKVEFERGPGMMVGLRALGKLLQALPPEHLQRRRLEDPETLFRLRDEDPPALLQAALSSAGRPLTAGEIRTALAGIVDEAGWTSWWAAARKHPQVVAGGAGRQTYQWLASSEGARDAIWSAFSSAAPAARLELFRRHAERSPELRGRMAGELARQATAARSSDPAFAFEAWFALERAAALPTGLGWSVESLIDEGADLRLLLAGLGDRLLRERALAMVRERRADWPTVFREALAREDDPRVLQTLSEGLRAGAPALRERFLEDLLAQPRRTPAAFIWLAERAAEDETLRDLAPLKLFQQILHAVRDDAFASYRTRLAALLDSGGTVPRLLSHFSEEQASQALRAIDRAAGLADFQRHPLINGLLLRFPALRTDEGLGELYCTPRSLEARRDELRRLVEVEIPTNRKAIEEARAHGDLRENFEYKAARERHEYLNARVAALHRDLGRARILDPATIDCTEVRVGTRVRLRSAPGSERAITILGPWDSRPEADVISNESELAQGLLGAKPGDEVQVGQLDYRVVAIEPYS